MQKKDRSRYNREFKKEAVRQTQETEKSVAEVARELELPVHQLYKWRCELERKKRLPEKVIAHPTKSWKSRAERTNPARISLLGDRRQG